MDWMAARVVCCWDIKVVQCCLTPVMLKCKWEVKKVFKGTQKDLTQGRCLWQERKVHQPPLAQIFSFPADALIDPFFKVFLGTGNTLSKLFLSDLIGKEVVDFNDLLKIFMIPINFQRKPRCVDEIGYWKAIDFKLWLFHLIPLASDVFRRSTTIVNRASVNFPSLFVCSQKMKLTRIILQRHQSWLMWFFFKFKRAIRWQNADIKLSCNASSLWSSATWIAWHWLLNQLIFFKFEFWPGPFKNQNKLQISFWGTYIKVFVKTRKSDWNLLKGSMKTTLLL